MQIVSLTIENYRSITSAKRIPFSEYTLFIGPNNEGKSNILKALTLAMTTLQRWRSRQLRRSDGKLVNFAPDKRYRSYDADYSWLKDYPLHLQKKKKPKASEITIEFLLDEAEITDFRTEIGSTLNGTLPIKIVFKRDEFDIVIAKPGRGSATLNSKTTRIASFVSSRIRFDYVPAVRTADSAEDVVRSLVSNELRALEDDPRYEQAMSLIDQIHAPVLEELSQSITGTVSRFLPSVKEISLNSSQASRSSLLRRSVQIDVDDGVRTDLGQKGDGVQSLVALALMRYASQGKISRHRSVIAIEEPESHLHPKAIRDLRDIIVGLSENGQVVVSSHSPLLVRWSGKTSTIIVGGDKAIVADKISAVRDCLGVMVSDNLSSVEFALIVEGISDKKIIRRFIDQNASKELIKLFDDGRFAIQNMGGVGKIGYQVASSEQNILGFHVFVDNDAAAIAEVSNAIGKGVLKSAEYTLCSCSGMKESEIEDLIKNEIYFGQVHEKYGVDLREISVKNRKWSHRMRDAFTHAGKLWSDGILLELKTIVAESVATSKPNPFIEQKCGSIKTMLKKMEQMADAPI